jgi:hypothetical protein
VFRWNSHPPGVKFWIVVIVAASIPIFLAGVYALAQLDGIGEWIGPLGIVLLFGWLWLSDTVADRNASVDREVRALQETVAMARESGAFDSGPRPESTAVAGSFREASQRWDDQHRT